MISTVMLSVQFLDCFFFLDINNVVVNSYLCNGELSALTVIIGWANGF